MSLSKKDISFNISVEANISLVESTKLLNIFIDLIKIKAKNNIVKIGRFGSFNSFYTKERTGRNPRTKEEYIIPEVLKIKFKPFNLVKKNIN
jgi:integration host factor subunit alpha